MTRDDLVPGMDVAKRSDVPPDTIGVELREEGVLVRYTDGRETLYRGVPEKIEGTLQTPPGKEVHVLVTDPSETEGVMIYVNDLRTHDDVLEDSGVGRLLLDNGERAEPFPGVEIEIEGYSVVVDADLEVAGGRVFVFAEDEMSEFSYELVEDA